MFQAPDGREFLVRSFTVAPEVVDQSKVTDHITREEFLLALDKNGRAVFERVLEHAGNATPEMAVQWGTVGFSMNRNVDGKQVAILEGYPPDSVYKQSIYTTRFGLTQTQVPDQEIADLWDGAQGTGLFQPAGKQLKCPIDHTFTEHETQVILKWFDDLAGAMAKYGLK